MKTVAITGFFKKFCITTRTKSVTVVDTISTTVIFYFLLFCRCFLREIRDFRNISTVEQTVMSHLPQPGVPKSTACENCNRYKNINDKLLFYIDIGNRPRPRTTPVMDGFPLYPRDRKDKKDRTGLVFSVILDTLIISQAPLLSQDVIYYALTLSFAKFPHEIIFCGNLTSPANNYGLLRFDFDFDETFKCSLLIWQNLLESAKRL